MGWEAMKGMAAVVTAAAVMGGAQAPALGRHSEDGERCGRGDRGRLLGYERVLELPAPADVSAYHAGFVELYTELGYVFIEPEPDIRYGVDAYEVRYCTIDGPRAVSATGLVAVPRRSGRVARVAYLHGTSVTREDAPSNPNFEEAFDTAPSVAAFAGAGFAYVAADYLGLGDSPVERHRYFHAASEASAQRDLLRAADDVFDELGVHTGELFIFGFSQGGHAALALHRELEAAGERVAATGTVGGIFDVERWFLDSLHTETATLPLYMADLLVAYDDLYDVYRSPERVFRAPYAALMPELFNGHATFDEVLASLAPSVEELLQPEFLAAFESQRRLEMRVRLRQNQVFRWAPQAPIIAYHSPDDEEVPFESARRSVAELDRRSRARVKLETIGGGLDHINSWLVAMPMAAEWFARRAGRD